VHSIVVLSPHSDDGVLSLGASMARWARSGLRVELLTVFALDPASGAPTKGWDGRAGFQTEGEAARTRREEDRRACSILGVVPSWLPFGSVDFDRHGDEDDVWKSVRHRVDGADLVLVPGAPLTHADHAWLHDLIVTRLSTEVVALYAEQPYTFRQRSTPFTPAAVSIRDRIAKWRAIRSYRSQLPLLAMDDPRRGPLRLSWAEERVSAPSGSSHPAV
jgi:LmbE family N-acetylglucosaminyl deacetylase